MECVRDKYIYKGKDISFLVIRKIEQVVSIIAEKENISFEEAYSNFLNSKTYRSLQNTSTLMWFENAEFITGEYYTTFSSGTSPASVKTRQLAFPSEPAR